MNEICAPSDTRDTGAGLPALELVSLVKSFGSVTAVAGIDLTVGKREFLTLLGPSGSGKTTVLRLVAGLEQATQGQVLLEGRDISALSPAERGVGVVFQHYALFPHMTVADNVRYPLKLRHWRRNEATSRVEEMLALVRLEGFGGRYPRQLSGGQQQRVAVARALAFRPALLLMDEPLGALDRALRVEMQEELRRIHRESETTAVCVTHDQEEALTMSDRIGIMREGRLLQVGTPEELYEMPVDTFVASFLGDCTTFGVEVLQEGEGRALVRGLGHEFEVRTSAPLLERTAYLAVRHGRLRLDPSPHDLRVSAQIVDILYLGETARVVATNMNGGGGEVMVARVDARMIRGLTPGRRVTLGFRPDDVVLVPDERR